MPCSYRFKTNIADPQLSFKFPTEMVRDLAIRSEESGRPLHIEILIRLARSLEHDSELQESDRLLERIYVDTPFETSDVEES